MWRFDSISRCRSCFNPLPSPKQGEIGMDGNEIVDLIVSIRSPHRSKGRCMDPEFIAIAEGMFQSAPLTEARGDAHQTHPSPDYIRVSIRSPHRSKGRFTLVLVDVSASMVSIRSPHRSKGRSSLPPIIYRLSRFQSAPLTEARGDWNGWQRNRRSDRFNPLPSPKQGEIRQENNLRLARISVSIRSPHRSKGRFSTRPCLSGWR